MHLRDILEARRNPEQNSALRSKDIAKTIEPFFFREDAYLSMVNIQKIGVNPSTGFDTTPAGIYAYPLAEQAIVSQFLNNRLPYASWAKYATVLIRKPEITMLTNETTDLEGPWLKLDQKMESIFGKDFWGKAKRTESKKAAQEFYRAAETGALLLTLMKKHSVAEIKGLTDVRQYLLRRDANRPRVWNGLLRQVGFDAVEDRGSKMIHPVEPFQTCFLSTQAIKTFSIFTNGRSDVYGENEIRSAGHFFRLVSNGEIDPFSAIKTMDAIMQGQDLPDMSRMSSYDPKIRFSDTQIATFLKWVSETKGADFDVWIKSNTGPWGITSPRLKVALSQLD